MVKEKGISALVGIVIIVAVAVVAFGGVFGYQYLTEKSEARNPKPETNPNDQNPNSQNIVGGDRDAHGCIGSAGYSWCEAKQKCLRTWEEPCEELNVPTTIKVRFPNGGETLKIGSTHTIEWATPGLSYDTYVSLVENMGGVTAPCTYLIAQFNNTSIKSDIQTYNWKVPSEYSSDMCGTTQLAGKQFKIMISFRDTNGRIVMSDQSDNYFTITK